MNNPTAEQLQNIVAQLNVLLDPIGISLATASEHGNLVCGGRFLKADKTGGPRYRFVIVTNDLADHLEAWGDKEIEGRGAAAIAAGIKGVTVVR